MLYLSGKGDRDTCKKLVEESISSGKALETLRKMIKAQGGLDAVIDDTSLLGKAKYSHEVKATKDGCITSVNTESYGLTALALGAGRNKVGDKIDYTAGIILNRKTGDKVKVGDVIATLYANDQSLFAKAEEIFTLATLISDKKPINRPLVLARIE
jgi:pyrimidine-nucleoside phosphorylase